MVCRQSRFVRRGTRQTGIMRANDVQPRSKVAFMTRAVYPVRQILENAVAAGIQQAASGSIGVIRTNGPV